MTEKTYTQKRWSLTDLFKSIDSPDLQVALEELEKLVAGFEPRRADLSAKIGSEDFLSVIRQLAVRKTCQELVECNAGAFVLLLLEQLESRFVVFTIRAIRNWQLTGHCASTSAN